MKNPLLGAEIEGESADARLNRYRLFDEVNAPYTRWQLEQFGPHIGARLLEVGCGVGSLLAQLAPREFVMGLDVEPEIIAFAERRFADRDGYRFANLDISSLLPVDAALLKSFRFDTALCVNVLEHVLDDKAAVAAMAETVQEGGAVLILVPAHPSLYGPYDQMEGHFRRYTKAGLGDLLTGAGLTVRRLHRFNAVGALGWWVQYRLLRRRIHRQSHFKVLQSVLPALRAVEMWLKPPFGLSLVAVATKEARPSS